jgi:hypothetical protein
MICPRLETGFAFSLYAVKLSSRHKTSGCVEPGGNEGERGELGVAWDAADTMLHIGQPSLGAKAMSDGEMIVAVRRYRRRCRDW